MPKPILESKFREWEGLDRISPTIHAMKCIYRELNKDDYGIDGEIEIVEKTSDGKGHQTTGKIIKLQAKSGISYIKQDSELSFFSPIRKDDLELWHQANYPIIYIVYHPQDDKLYWKDLKSYIRETPGIWQRPHKISFKKEEDEFSPACYRALCSLVPESQATRISFERERLISNLLRIERIPEVWSAQCFVTHYDHIRSSLHAPAPPYAVVGTQIYTFANLHAGNCVLREFCDTSTIKSERFDGWWGNEVLERNYVFMLKQLLGTHLRQCGTRYNREFQRDYFPRENQVDIEFKTAWYNVRTGNNVRPRLTAKFYTYGYNSFWRHAAVEMSFRRIGQAWFLQIIPKYLFTEDGIFPWDPTKVGEYTTQIKASETNQHVLNHVLFWADVLSRSRRGSYSKAEIVFELEKQIVMIIDKMPVSGIAEFGIPFDPAVFEEPAAGQTSFLDRLGKPEEGSDDD